MKVDVSQVVRNLEGDPFKKEDGKDLTIRSLACMALLTQTREEKQTGEEKVELYDLAMRIHKCGKEIELKSEEITTIKKRIGEQYAALIVGQAWEMLEKGGRSES